MKIKKIAAAAAVAAVAVVGSALVAPAFADPVSNSYVLVGSDTLQDSTNALVNGTTVNGAQFRVTVNNSTLGSFDAFGSALIQTKAGGPYFTRPSGSGPGVNALSASISSKPFNGKVITGQVDIARSSSSPGTNKNADGLLAYYPYARDAVAYAYKGGNSSWANLTAAQLKEIYDGTTTSIGGVTVKPRLPQAGSGTRNFFLKGLGYAADTVPVAVATGDSTNKTAENDASVLQDGELIPFSVASWVAQANNATPSNTTTLVGVAMGSPIAGVTPFTGTGSSLVPNSAFYSDGTFGRDTFLVVERARVTVGDAKYDANLVALLDSTKSRSLTGFADATNGGVKKKFGFLAPSSTTVQYAYTTLPN